MTVSAFIARALFVSALSATVTAASVTAPVAIAPRHELPDNRATLVLRDDRHLSITLYINYVDALHRAIAPRMATSEFLTRYSAMNLATLRAELQRVQRQLQSATRLTIDARTPLALSDWRWPTAEQVQALIQQSVMQAVVAPNDHVTEPQSEIHAEAVGVHTITGVDIRLPREFLRVLVVSYRPNQVWANPDGPATSVRFDK